VAPLKSGLAIGMMVAAITLEKQDDELEKRMRYLLRRSAFLCKSKASWPIAER